MTSIVEVALYEWFSGYDLRIERHLCLHDVYFGVSTRERILSSLPVQTYSTSSQDAYEPILSYLLKPE